MQCKSNSEGLRVFLSFQYFFDEFYFSGFVLGRDLAGEGETFARGAWKLLPAHRSHMQRYTGMLAEKSDKTNGKVLKNI